MGQISDTFISVYFPHNVRQSTKIDTLSQAFKALGKQLDFIVAADHSD